MSKHNVVCCFCDEPIEPCETAICKGCIDELHKNIRKLQARIAELEAQVIVWHKYPEEKPQLPDDNPTDVANIPVIIQTASGLVHFADYNTDSGRFWRYGGRVDDVNKWQYLPEPPKIDSMAQEEK